MRRRLEGLEARTVARASPEGRPPWRTPEQHAEREEQFRRLRMRIGGEWPPPKSGEAALEELFEAIQSYRDRHTSTDRKEQDHE
ncbi:MAG: hypothetical protein M3P49_06685 [Actinomycetota bacterium]|nr:hypothetical protein [Actinomycetota bacterium]